MPNVLLLQLARQNLEEARQAYEREPGSYTFGAMLLAHRILAGIIVFVDDWGHP